MYYFLANGRNQNDLLDYSESLLVRWQDQNVEIFENEDIPTIIMKFQIFTFETSNFTDPIDTGY